MARRTNRRKFMQTTAALGVGYWVAGGVSLKESLAANERIRFASVGIGGKGDSDSANAAKHGDMVAICDIDDQRLGTAGEKKFPDAKRYNDYRKMLDEMGKNIDAVTVSTPDHHHAAAAVMAMKLGKHCYCQKPLTHSVFEARTLANVAREMKVATQMGNQGTAGDKLREAAAVVKSGYLGAIKEVHVWTNRPIWPQGGDRPKPADKTPENVHWDLFIGPAPMRPFAPGYHPFAWRGWWDFGTGALGDMACHTFNMPFMALDLKNPTSIEAENGVHNRDSYPAWSVIKFQFPGTDKRAAIPVTWYDGGKKPPKELLEGKPEMPNSGALIVGEKGTLHAQGDYCGDFEILGGLEMPKIDYVKCPTGSDENGHVGEWVQAMRGSSPATSNFPDYAGPLTETILLGNLAVWVGKSDKSEGKVIQWDSKNLKATNAPEVDEVINRKYREGWTL